MDYKRTINSGLTGLDTEKPNQSRLEMWTTANSELI